MKKCFFSENGIEHIDYKSVELLEKYVGPSGNIQAKKRTGTCSRHHRKLENAIKRARFMGLMPYVAK